ncbi:MAG TPA: hypothetical protein PLW81_11075 [Thiobacillaceae bacterium]|nr:hypothetical protein [Thiobacillaceae bacterium]
MRKPYIRGLLVLLFGLTAAFTALAGDAWAASPEPAVQTTQKACPLPADARPDLAEVSQTDCCKGHKGVCGCRAGKIVCCDGTVSPNCTCHGDDGLLN